MNMIKTTKLLFLFTLIFALFIQCDLDKVDPFVEPEAIFRASNDSCIAPCDPGIINSSRNAVRQEWIINGFNRQTTINPVVPIQDPGTYSIRLVVFSKDSLSDDSISSVFIRPPLDTLPKASFRLSNNNCKAPCDPGFVNESENATDFQWNFGDGGSSNADNPSYVYQSEGEYNVSLIASDNEGNRDNTTVSVTIAETDLTSANFRVVTDLDTCPAPCTVSFENTSLRGLSFEWNFGDPNSGSKNFSTDQNATSHQYVAPGTYTVQLQSNGVRNQDNHEETITVRSWQCGDPIIDQRDGQRYQTIWIDNNSGNNLNLPGQCWMAENLKFNASLSKCFDNKAENCEEYGKMYEFLTLANFCPSGWKMAGNSDWDELFGALGLNKFPQGQNTIYIGDLSPVLAGGSTGMEIKLGGTQRNGQFSGLNEIIDIWTEDDFIVSIDGKDNEVFINNTNRGEKDVYMRCIQNN